MKNKTVNTAIIGCGRLAEHYFKILNSGAVKGINIIGVCDENPSKSNEYAKLFNCAGHTDYETMLKKIKPDLVLILTPSGFHTLHTRIALEHNTNVMVEKPLSLLPSDTKSLIALAKSKNLTNWRTVINTGAESGQTVIHLHIHFLSGRKMNWPPG